MTSTWAEIRKDELELDVELELEPLVATVVSEDDEEDEGREEEEENEASQKKVREFSVVPHPRIDRITSKMNICFGDQSGSKCVFVSASQDVLMLRSDTFLDIFSTGIENDVVELRVASPDAAAAFVVELHESRLSLGKLGWSKEFACLSVDFGVTEYIKYFGDLAETILKEKLESSMEVESGTVLSRASEPSVQTLVFWDVVSALLEKPALCLPKCPITNEADLVPILIKHRNLASKEHMLALLSKETCLDIFIALNDSLLSTRVDPSVPPPPRMGTVRVWYPDGWKPRRLFVEKGSMRYSDVTCNDVTHLPHRLHLPPRASERKRRIPGEVGNGLNKFNFRIPNNNK